MQQSPIITIVFFLITIIIIRAHLHKTDRSYFTIQDRRLGLLSHFCSCARQNSIRAFFDVDLEKG